MSVCNIVLVNQPSQVHARWMHDFGRYTKYGQVFQNPAQYPDRPNISRPSRLIWFSAPAVVSQGREHNTYITTQRAKAQEEYSVELMKRMGVSIVDGWRITQSRWDASYDGIHYLLQFGPDYWVSHTSNMVTQVLFNVIFPNCSGPSTVPTNTTEPPP